MKKFQAKDYLLANDIYAAVISSGIEDDRVLTTARYFENSQHEIIKLNTDDAQTILQEQHPDWLFYSTKHDITVHGIPVDEIDKHYRPVDFLHYIKQQQLDQKQQQAVDILELLYTSGVKNNDLGITGSLLIGQQNPDSDIDVVIYGRRNFHKVRQFIQKSLNDGLLDNLSDSDWQESYSRRDCAIELEDYVFHERRKANKFIYQGTKVDVSMVLLSDEEIQEALPYKKSGRVRIKAQVIDDSGSYDLPARYYLDSSVYPELLCYTATYTGQAQQGEWIEISAMVEENQAGDKRLIVGTSREASNEYIKLVSI